MIGMSMSCHEPVHVGKENLTRGVGISTRDKACHDFASLVMPICDPRDRFFYPHHTPMIDIFSCIPFDLPHLIFIKELV